MLETFINFGILCFTTFITLINPISTLPAFMTMTDNMQKAERNATATRAVIFAFCTLMLFAFAGNAILNFFNITIYGFQVVGGVLFFKMGFDMLHARQTRMKLDKKEMRNPGNDISFVPLGIPMICGPGSITNIIILMDKSNTNFEQFIIIASVMAVCLIVLFAFYFGTFIINLLGETGIKVMTRLMGLILMVIAVEYFFAGLKPLLQSISGNT